jgi:hypothetical protein
VREDGGLDVAPIEGHGPDGERLGTPLVLPPSYVAEHLALGYASTVHAAQGATVDSAHTVVTSRTGPNGLYVGMSRGREANTAHVATLTGVNDPAQGSDQAHALYRDPVAVLARVLDTSDAADAANRSALATATQAATAAGSTRTAADLLADAAQLAATSRTATWLDQLTQDGVLDPVERSRIAAEDGAATLTRILRRAELAGHDPHQVLHDAVAERPFDDARNVSNTIYSRIRTEHRDRLDPIGDSFTAWAPRVDEPEWRDYLAALAEKADQRSEQLGAELADAAPAWLTSAIGDVPTESDARAEWQRRAGLVAAYREMRGHDDPADALGPAPKPGQVEQYAAYRAAWRALGRPEIEREELEMTDGQLRMWVRAAKREEAWGPRYVGNELAGTRQAAAAHRQTAELRAAEADAAADPAEQERLRADAAQARALAETLDEQAEKLQVIDDARAHFLADNARTLGYGRRCEAELSRRHIDDTEPEQIITAEEWLTAHRAAVDEDDQHRAITETDLTDTTTADDDRTRPALDLDGDAIEVPDRDIRELAADEPAPVNEDVVRIPSPDETAVDYAKATRALAELNARRAADEQEQAEHRAAELDRWHVDDQTATDASEAADAEDETDSLDSYDPTQEPA